jgi:hypothetical protein
MSLSIAEKEYFSVRRFKPCISLPCDPIPNTTSYFVRQDAVGIVCYAIFMGAD